MKSKYFLIAAGVTAVISLNYWGRTTEKKKFSEIPAVTTPNQFSINLFIQSEKEKLSPSLRQSADSLQGLAEQAENKDKLLSINALADFWRNQAHQPELYCYYLSEAAKLDNSEKNLSFAAQLSVDILRSQKDESRVDWLSSQSIDLFERAIRLNPDNDDLKVGLGSAYIFGRGRTGHPEETMKGVQQLLAVARKDSNNMKAQLMLGIGGFISGQYEKAASRLEKVVAREPENLEAVAFLADSYAAMGKKEEAIRWYEVSKRLANNPDYAREVDERIRTMR